MRFIAGFYLGILFLLVGIVLLLNVFFHFHLNVFKLLVGTLIISLGILILFNGLGFQSSRDIILKEGSIVVSDLEEEYNILFSSGRLDLSKVKLESGFKKVKINNLFAEGKLLLNPEVPALIHASSVFGQLILPDNSSVNFGSRDYQIGEIKPSQGYLKIEANAIFGRLSILFRE
ncbi:MAG: hypothetical protein Kow00103_03690 [Candidatus Caldatribacteriota bacterium]